MHAFQLSGFPDVARSMEAAWEVWFATQSGAQYLDWVAQHRLRGLVAGARERSPFYRNLYRGLPETGYSLVDLPVVTKHNLMAHFDVVVTDPDLTRDRVDGFLADPARVGQPLDHRYAVWTSSGTTGEPGSLSRTSKRLPYMKRSKLSAFAVWLRPRCWRRHC